MEMTIRATTPVERFYANNQSTAIEERSGLIGYLQGHMGDNGQEFHKSWQTRQEELRTPKFKEELRQVIRALRFDESYSGILENRDALERYCHSHPESGFKHDPPSFGFRVDTRQFSYFLRLDLHPALPFFYCYCYQREWLERHMKNAERGIRFITPRFEELFRIQDGDRIRITREDGSHEDEICRYIDDYHMETGNGWSSLYHICQFAEQMERSHSTVIPLRSSLPEKCFSFLDDTGESILIERGVLGYQRTGQWVQDGFTPEEGAAALNEMVGTTKAQSAAMKAGAFFGWATPQADPKNYDEQGQFKKPRQRELER